MGEDMAVIEPKHTNKLRKEIADKAEGFDFFAGDMAKLVQQAEAANLNAIMAEYTDQNSTIDAINKGSNTPENQVTEGKNDIAAALAGDDDVGFKSILDDDYSENTSKYVPEDSQEGRVTTKESSDVVRKQFTTDPITKELAAVNATIANLIELKKGIEADDRYIGGKAIQEILDFSPSDAMYDIAKKKPEFFRLLNDVMEFKLLHQDQLHALADNAELDLRQYFNSLPPQHNQRVQLVSPGDSNSQITYNKKFEAFRTTNTELALVNNANAMIDSFDVAKKGLSQLQEELQQKNVQVDAKFLITEHSAPNWRNNFESVREVLSQLRDNKLPDLELLQSDKFKHGIKQLSEIKDNEAASKMSVYFKKHIDIITQAAEQTPKLQELQMRQSLSGVKVPKQIFGGSQTLEARGNGQNGAEIT